MEISDAITYLSEDAVDLRPEHLGRHDDRKEVVRGVFHDLVIMAVVANDVDCLDHIDMFQTCTDGEFCTNFLLVFPFCLACAAWPEFFDCVDSTA